MSASTSAFRLPEVEALIDRFAPRPLRGVFKRFAHLREEGEEGEEIKLFASSGKRYLSFVLEKREGSMTRS